LGWVGSRLAPKAVSHGLFEVTSPARLGPNLRLSGHTAAHTAAQTADDPQAAKALARRRYRRVEVGGRGFGTQKFVHRKWPDQIVPL